MRRVLLVIAGLVMAGCAAKHVPVSERVISIDQVKPQHQCVCPEIPVCEERKGMRWNNELR